MRRIVLAIKNRWRRQRGFTLIELMSVMAILSVLSAVTFPAVSGSVTTSRATTQSVDISAVQRASDWFKSEAVTRYPSLGSPGGTSTTWLAGQIPEATSIGGDGSTPDSPIIFTQEAIAGIDFNAAVNANDELKRFSGNYVRSRPAHDSSIILLAPGDDSDVFHIQRRGRDVYVLLRNTTGDPITFGSWGLDINAEVWVFVDQNTY